MDVLRKEAENSDCLQVESGDNILSQVAYDLSNLLNETSCFCFLVRYNHGDRLTSEHLISTPMVHYNILKSVGYFIYFLIQTWLVTQVLDKLHFQTVEDQKRKLKKC